MNEFCDLAEKISIFIKKIKKVVTTFNCSNNLSRDLRKVQQDNPLTLLSDLSNTVKRKNILYLIQDIITRWNSTHDMIERFLKLRIFINDVINTSADHRTKTNKYLLNIDEIEVAECMLIILKPFKIITNMLSHSKLTSSRILPCLV
jgi:hypothetical protein